jgi:hypothetical protein
VVFLGKPFTADALLQAFQGFPPTVLH